MVWFHNPHKTGFSIFHPQNSQKKTTKRGPGIFTTQLVAPPCPHLRSFCWQCPQASLQIHRIGGCHGGFGHVETMEGPGKREGWHNRNLDFLTKNGETVVWHNEKSERNNPVFHTQKKQLFSWKKIHVCKNLLLSFLFLGDGPTRCSLQTRWDFQQNVLDWEQSLGPFGTPKPPFWQLTFRPVYSAVNCHSN